MEMIPIINIIAFVLTAVGTGITIKQAINAKNSASIAENAKKTILERKQLHVYDEILSKSHEVEKILIVWKSNTSTKKGLNVLKDRQVIEALISLINEQKQNIMSECDSIDDAQNLLIKYLDKFKENEPYLINTLNQMHDAVRTIARIVSKEKQMKEYK